METAHRHPTARQDGLVVRELPGELLIYDLGRHRAHCLNSTAAAVFRAADGGTLEDIRSRAGADLGEELTEEIVLLALEQLDGLHLLDAPPSRKAGLDRAQLIRRAALVAGAVALPAAASLAVPTAAAAQSCVACGQPCAQSNQCCPACSQCLDSGRGFACT